MNWLARLLPSRNRDSVTLPPQLREALSAWRTLPEADLDRPHIETRYVILNTRASSVDAGTAQLQSVAAIAVDNGRIRPAHSYLARLDGEPAAALTGLLQFVGAGPVVVYNAELNRHLIERALQRHLGIRPGWLWLDLYWLLPALFGEAYVKPTRLAEWMDALDLHTFQRFHALGDAWVLAKLLLAVQSRARAEDRRTPRALADLELGLRAIAMR